MSKHFDVITIGGAVRDITFYTNAGRVFRAPNDLTAQRILGFEYGSKINIDKVNYNYGGGAFNAAYTFSKMGLKVGALVRVGNDKDSLVIKNKMKKEGIYDEFVQTDYKLPTGFSFIVMADKKDHEYVAFMYRGANNNLEISDKALKYAAAHWFYISSLSGENWQKNLKNAFSYAKKVRAKIIWNPGRLQIQAGKQGTEKYLQQTDILILNKDEALELVLSGIKIGQKNPRFLNKPLYLLNILSEWGPKIVVITAGSKGAYALKDNRLYKTKAVLRKVVDTTGVGDAFGSAFVSGLIYEKNDIGRALRWGAVNSSNVLSQIGAQNGIMTKEEIIAALKKFK